MKSFSSPRPLQYEAEGETCKVPVDVVLALDRSSSMQGEGPDAPLELAKNAAQEFVGRLALRDHVGYISFATDASNPMDQRLTENQ